jgi:hypothetical protein
MSLQKYILLQLYKLRFLIKINNLDVIYNI